MESVCRNSEKHLRFFAKPSTYFSALEFCTLLGGESILPSTSLETKEIIKNYNEDEANQCKDLKNAPFLWTGFNDIDIEGVFSYKQDEYPLTAWYKNEPNGKRIENCAELRYYGRKAGFLNDEDCDTVTECTACTLSYPVKFNLRGMCDQKEIDQIYFLIFTNDSTTKNTFYGSSLSKIIWNVQNKVWSIQSLSGNTTKASTSSADFNYPLGTRVWNIHEGKCAGRSIKMSFTSCNESTFACRNGMCIAIENKCDMNIDCEDQSDEEDCTIVIIPKGYKNDYLKKQSQNEFDVALSFRLDEILEISEDHQTVFTMFSVMLSWYDTRLQYHDLRTNSAHNSLNNIMKSKIWIPDVKFLNNPSGISTSRLKSDTSATVSIIRNGTGAINSPTEAIRRLVYDGNSSQIIKLGYYSTKTVCIFDLVYFPFDHQKCAILMEIESNNRTPPRVKPVLSKKSPELEKYGKYLVTNISILLKGSRVLVEISLGRSLLGSLMTVHMPSLIINILNQATTYFGSENFDTIVTVNLSSMMVLSALLISVSNSLPPTTYLKVKRKWDLICVLTQIYEGG